MDARRLAKKLNLKTPLGRALFLAAPEAVGPLIVHLRDDLGIEVDREPDESAPYDYVHAFVERSAQAADLLPVAVDALAEAGLLWVSYPKKSSKRYASDVSRDSDAWAPLYERDFEPVRQVSVDDDWSALRFRPVNDIGSFTRGFAGSEAGKRRSETEGR